MGINRHLRYQHIYLSYQIQVDEYAPKRVGWVMCFVLMSIDLVQLLNMDFIVICTYLLFLFFSHQKLNSVQYLPIIRDPLLDVQSV